MKKFARCNPVKTCSYFHALLTISPNMKIPSFAWWMLNVVFVLITTQERMWFQCNGLTSAVSSMLSQIMNNQIWHHISVNSYLRRTNENHIKILLTHKVIFTRFSCHEFHQKSYKFRNCGFFFLNAIPMFLCYYRIKWHGLINLKYLAKQVGGYALVENGQSSE